MTTSDTPGLEHADQARQLLKDATQMPAFHDEITSERIYEDLKAYAAVGLIKCVLPAEPLGEEWIIGWDGRIFKFTTEEGIIGFLTGIAVATLYKSSQRRRSPLEPFLP